jgi:hypothetical protein
MSPSEYEYHKSMTRGERLIVFLAGVWCGVVLTLLLLLGGK